jgi:adenylate cyclase
MTALRKLACIVFTDIVGYTSLMGSNEQHAFELLQKNRSIQKPIIEELNGRILKEMGDGLMAVFETTSEAVSATLRIQEKVQEAGEYQLRIGIHMGEVIVDQEDIFGDGVNIASRVQAIAEPGRIYISEAVHNNISNKPDLMSRFVREERLKNVQQPVKIFEMVMNNNRLISASPGKLSQVQDDREVFHDNSIAVLPFINMSNDTEQEFFCDGITEEIINTLGQLNLIRVVARTSTFAFKNKTIDLREIGKSLDVRSILEGSVRKAGKRLRINTQLVNAVNGTSLWSNQYDRELEDIFAIQEDIAQNVATAIKGFLTSEEKEVIRRPETKFEAYEYFLKGLGFFHQLFLISAVQMFKRAIEIDDQYALGYSGLADTHSWLYEWEGSKTYDLQQAQENSLKAVSLAPNLAEAHASRGYTLSLAKKYEEADHEFGEAIRLNSNCFNAYYFNGRSGFARGDVELSAKMFRQAADVRKEDYQSLLLLCQSLLILKQDNAKAVGREGIERARKQLALNPNDVRALSLGSTTLFDIGELPECYEWMERALILAPEDSGVLFNGTCLYAKSGMIDKALDLLEKAMKRGSGNKSWILKDPDYNSLHGDPRFIALLENKE